MKKFLSLILAFAMILSCVLSVSAVTLDKAQLAYNVTDERCISLDDAVKAYEEENGVELETYRNYFYIPESNSGFFDSDTADVPLWQNEYSENICIWYDSSMAENAPLPEDNCGYALKKKTNNVYYADIPVDVKQFVINNGVEVDADPALSACRTITLGLEAADKFGNFPNHNNEIYVLKKYEGNKSSATAYFSGVWYIYKGMDCYSNNKSDCLNPTHDHKSVKEAVAEYEESTGEKLETNRYYFLMPNGENGMKGADPDSDKYGKFADSWSNQYTSKPAIYWWDEDAKFNPDMYPGYTLEQDMYNSVYYADVPEFVESVYFNNNLCFSHSDNELEQYAFQTYGIGTQYYDHGESDNYPEGVDSFDEMIFVVSPDVVIVDWPLEPLRFGGEWYYYYGQGCYGTTKDGDNRDCIRMDHTHDHRPFSEILKEYEEETGEKVETKRYYFLMPDGVNGEICEDEQNKNYGKLAPSWYNENAYTAGIYWWDKGVIKPNKWPGYKMDTGDSESVFYVDLPVYVESVIFDNYFDCGLIGWWDPVYFDMAETINVYMYGYEAGESNTYPDGLDSFENMIYVLKYDCDYELEPQNIWAGEWYYYYGDGCYGTTKDGDKSDCSRRDHMNENGEHISDESIIGDVDGDGEVSIMDVTEIQLVVAKLKETPEDIAVADIDGDGSVTILDATAIQLILAKIDA
ncbi:MAG: dockerin type I repeat-containing protein [Ruminococcus sp.]|nr:dockerin type I repeat-containing protein [Ruminococcus sp.]